MRVGIGNGRKDRAAVVGGAEATDPEFGSGGLVLDPEVVQGHTSEGRVVEGLYARSCKTHTG